MGRLWQGVEQFGEFLHVRQRVVVDHPLDQVFPGAEVVLQIAKVDAGHRCDVA